MSDSSRSFWSSVPGFVTGLAGLLTAIVGLITVAVQLGWVGGGKSSSKDAQVSTTVTTYPGQTTVVPNQSPLGSTSLGVGSFVVTPSPIDFKSGGPREQTVTIKNTGTTTIDVPLPQVTDPATFSVADVSCLSRVLTSGSSCDVKLTFKPSGVLQRYAAQLTVTPRGASSQNIAITASTLIG